MLVVSGPGSDILVKQWKVFFTNKVTNSASVLRPRLPSLAQSKKSIMGRVSRYKRIKACDPFSKQSLSLKHRHQQQETQQTTQEYSHHRQAAAPRGETIWGYSNDGRKVKKRSRTAQRLYDAKWQRRLAQWNGNNQKNSVTLAPITSNTSTSTATSQKKNKVIHHRPPTFDVSYDENDEFDLNDLEGSLKRQTPWSVEGSDVITASAHFQQHDLKEGLNCGHNNNDNKINRSAATPMSTKVIKLSTVQDEDIDVKSETADEGSLLVSSEPMKQISKRAENEEQKATSQVLKKIEESVVAQSIMKKDQQQLSATLSRGTNESKRAHARRMQSETKHWIVKDQQSDRNPEKRERRNSYLKQKKLKKQLGKRALLNNDGGVAHANDDNSDCASTNMDHLPLFGEQVERPPVFHHLPRGAKKSNSTIQTKNIKQSTKAATTTTSLDKEIIAEQKSMELLRQRVQAQYAIIKSQRRQRF
jgi:hypothetical protein